MSYGIKSVAVNATSDGENEIVAAVAGKRIIVVGYCLTPIHVSGSTEIDLRSGTSNTIHARFMSGIDAGMGSAALGGISQTGSREVPLFECDIGDSLALNNGAGVDTKGIIQYYLG